MLNSAYESTKQSARRRQIQRGPTQKSSSPKLTWLAGFSWERTASTEPTILILSFVSSSLSFVDNAITCFSCWRHMCSFLIWCFLKWVSCCTTRHWSQYVAEEGKPYSFDSPATSSSPKFWDGGQAPLHRSSEYLLNVWLRIAMVHVHQSPGCTRGTEGRRSCWVEWPTLVILALRRQKQEVCCKV